MPTFHAADLRAFCQGLLITAGVPEPDASLLTELLLNADLQGYPGHGVSHLPSYVERIERGLIRLDARPTVVQEGKTTAILDGGFYVGQVVPHEAMSRAIAKAAEHGVGIVCARHAGHVGRLADYVRMAADRGMIGIAAVSVGGGNIAPYGGMEPIAGTNPMAFGVPGRDGAHIILDFATSIMSMGELLRRVALHEPIPDGVMLDGAGQPTTDYAAFRGPPRGVVLPFGGHKGSGLHIMTEVLGGILSGNGIGRDWLDRGGAAINGALFQAIDVEEFQPLDTFLDRMDELAAFVHSRKPAPGFAEILLPGEGASRRAARHAVEGVPLDDHGWTELRQCAAKLGVTRLPEPIERV